MCLHQPLINGLNKWNWDGDHIYFDGVLPSGRPPVGRSRPSYPVDVREFVLSENNAVVRKTMHEDVKTFMKSKGMNDSLFTARIKTAFDYRMNVITAFVSETLRYIPTQRHDPWQYPEETLFLGGGD